MRTISNKPNYFIINARRVLPHKLYSVSVPLCQKLIQALCFGLVIAARVKTRGRRDSNPQPPP